MRFTHAGHLFLATVGLFSVQAQSTAKPEWEVLMERPLPGDAIPNIHVVALPLPPAPESRPAGPGHTHAGPVFGYVVQGRIENQVEPDPPEVFNPGDVFYEAPKHVHRFMRNLSTAESSYVIAFMAGYEGGAAPAIRVLFHDDLATVTDQEVRLLRLTLPPGASVDAPDNANRDAVAVLEGEVAVGGDELRIYHQNDFFAKPARPNGLRISNPSSERIAKVLLYGVVRKGTPSPNR